MTQPTQAQIEAAAKVLMKLDCQCLDWQSLAKAALTAAAKVEKMDMEDCDGDLAEIEQIAESRANIAAAANKPEPTQAQIDLINRAKVLRLNTTRARFLKGQFYDSGADEYLRQLTIFLDDYLTAAAEVEEPALRDFIKDTPYNEPNDGWAAEVDGDKPFLSTEQRRWHLNLVSATRLATIERCARVAEQFPNRTSSADRFAIAAAIRALKDKP